MNDFMDHFPRYKLSTATKFENTHQNYDINKGRNNSRIAWNSTKHPNFLPLSFRRQSQIILPGRQYLSSAFPLPSWWLTATIAVNMLTGWQVTQTPRLTDRTCVMLMGVSLPTESSEKEMYKEIKSDVRLLLLLLAY